MRGGAVRSRLFYSYSLLILLIVLSIIIVTTLVFTDYLIKSYGRSIEERLADMESRIREEIFGVVDLCDEVKKNPEVQRLLDSYGAELVDSYSALIRLHSQITATNYIVGRLLLLKRDLTILDPVYERVLYREAILNNPGFTEFLSGNYSYYFSSPGTFPIERSGGSDADGALTIVMYQKLLDDNYWPMGYLLAVLRKEALFSSIWLENQDELFAGITVFNTRNESVHREGAGFSPEDIGTDFRGINTHTVLTVKMHSGGSLPGKYMVFIHPVSGTNWYLTGLVPYSTILGELRNITRYIIILGFFFIIAAFSISYFLAGTITRPLLSVTAAMHAYDERQILEPIDVRAEGELAYLVSVYNRLVDSLNVYIANIYEEQEKKKEAELLSLQYELDFLQAQINPHFIHNTLNAIGCQARNSGNHEIYESLKSFNLLLRAAISGTEELIELSGEILLVENYIRILQFRYSREFRLEIEVEDGLAGMMVPKLILQPIVENSIFHGIEPSSRDGCIRIRAERAEDCIILSVADNGLGMPTVEIDKLLKSSTVSRHFNRIGVKNVDDRIKILFGEGYGLSIESREGTGTVVSIRMPRQEVLC